MSSAFVVCLFCPFKPPIPTAKKKEEERRAATRQVSGLTIYDEPSRLHGEDAPQTNQRGESAESFIPRSILFWGPIDDIMVDRMVHAGKGWRNWCEVGADLLLFDGGDVFIVRRFFVRPDKLVYIYIGLMGFQRKLCKLDDDRCRWAPVCDRLLNGNFLLGYVLRWFKTELGL